MAMGKLCWSSIVLSFVLTATVVLAVETFVDVELSKSVVNLGEDVELTCHMEGQRGLYILWVRKIGDKEVQLATNNFLNNDYLDHERYSMQAEYEQIKDPNNPEVMVVKVTYTLTIKEVTAAESGDIGCTVPLEDLGLFRTLTVLVPIQSMEMTTALLDGTDAVSHVDGEQLTFDEDDVRRFTCRVQGSYPAPEVRILLSGKDVTDRFNKTTELLLTPDNENLDQATFEVVVTYNAMKMDFDYADKQLTCDAKVPQPMAGNESSISVNITLTGYKPQFLCPSVMIAKLKEHPFNITCLVRSDPPGDNFTFSWERTISSGDNETLRDGHKKGHYNAFVVEEDDPREVTMILQIDQVNPQHFRGYFFEAVNALGIVRHRIDLKEDTTETPLDENEAASASPSKGVIETFGELGGGGTTPMLSSLAATILSLLAAAIII